MCIRDSASCRGALHNVQKLKTVSGFLAVLALGVSPLLSFLIAQPSLWLTVGISAIALFSSLIWWQLSRLEKKFFQGIAIPARNKDH